MKRSRLGAEVCCKVCGAVFYVSPSHLDRVAEPCCSQKCSHESMKSGVERCCKVCGVVFYVSPSRLAKLHCSQKCYDRDRAKPFIINDGRIILRVNKLQIHRARVVMEQMLGRSLKPGEEVHHINGDTMDDRLENLQLFASKAEHTSFHRRRINND